MGKCSQKHLYDRTSCHLAFARRGSKTYCHKWLRGLLADGVRPDVVVLEEIQGEWVEAEQFWILYLRFLGARLTNLTAGGEGLTGRRMSGEEIEKMRARHKGTSRSEETKARMRAAWTPERRQRQGDRLKGKSLSEAARANMSVAARGKKLTDSHKKAIGAAVAGRILTDNHKRKVGEGIRRAWTPERRAAMSKLVRERRRAARRDTCKQGHPLSGDNLYIDPHGAHCCRTCRNAERRERRRKLRELASLAARSEAA